MSVMPKELQILKLKEHVKGNYPSFDIQEIDFGHSIDSSLSYPENLSKIERFVIDAQFKDPPAEAVPEIENNELKDLNAELKERIEKLKHQKIRTAKYIPVDRFIEKIAKEDLKEVEDSKPVTIKDFYDTLSFLPRVIIIAGKKGEGKTALAIRLLERIKNRARYTIGIAIPIAVKVNEPEDIPNNSVVFINEAGINFSYFDTWSDRARYLIEMLEILRHKDIIVILDIKNMAILNINIIRNCDTLILKRPSLMQNLFDRPQLRPYIAASKEIFSKIKDTKPYAFVIDDYTEFVGIIKEILPDCWNEEISKSWSNY